MANPLSTTGLLMPENFENVAYDAVSHRVSQYSQNNVESWKQFAGAWNGLSYRFRACSDHNMAFTQSITLHGDAPAPEERYLQERELFAFFVSGLAVLESFCYGLYAIASILSPTEFSMKTDKEQRCVTPKRTREKYEVSYQSENITTLLGQTIDTSEYEAWQKIRNILAHRVGTQRDHFLHLPSKQRKPSQWAIRSNMEMEFSLDLTALRFKWLTKSLNDLLIATDEFSITHFP